MRYIIFSLTGVLLIIAGCARMSVVQYPDVQATNYVALELTNGDHVEGTVLKNEPHQITLVNQMKVSSPIPKSRIKTIHRKPPILDDFREGISEEEIRMKKTSKNSMFYTIGGTALSFGTSFFVGSMLANQMDDNGGMVLAGTTIGGTVIGGLLFNKAGRNMDWQESIARIRKERQEKQIFIKPVEKQNPESLRKQMEEEQEKGEMLRKQREELLRKLNIDSDEE